MGKGRKTGVIGRKRRIGEEEEREEENNQM